MPDNIININMGEMAVGNNKSIIKTSGIGSCLAIILYDKEKEVTSSRTGSNEDVDRHNFTKLELSIEHSSEFYCRYGNNVDLKVNDENFCCYFQNLTE